MLYPNNFEQKIGFDEIRTQLKGHCISRLGVDRVEAMNFTTDIDFLRQRLSEVQDIDRLLDEEGQLPGEDFFDLRFAIKRIRVEGVSLEEQEMWELKRSLDTLHAWVEAITPPQPSPTGEGEGKSPSPPSSSNTDFSSPSPAGEGRGGVLYPALSRLAEGVFTFHQVTRRIEQILDRYGHVKDDASPELSRIRHEIRRSEGSVNRTLMSILDSAKQEGLIDQHVMPTMRDGRLMIPISPAMKRRIRGIVHDESATGKTVFIEPSAVVEANNRIRELEADERREVKRILMEFTDTLRPNLPELQRAFEFLADVEFALAKQRMAQQMEATVPKMGEQPYIDWTLARHPLLEQALRHHGKKVVPLDIKLTRRQRILIISGPNAGGKSVCLKTVGLLQYMLQCGLPVPMGVNSQTGIFKSIFIDIGDEQSIADDLSTYSSHLLNMKNMMRHCDPASLLLIDEFGGGTEPTIGGAMAEAVLKRYLLKGTFSVITTHYQNLKHFADDHDGIVNGAMLYDRHQMQALFQLQMGNPGSSFAIEIARKIGIPEDVIADATELVGQDYVNADKYLLDIVRDKRYWETKRQNIHSREKDMEQTIAQYEREMQDLQHRRKEIIREAKAQAEQILAESNARVENVIREIRESQADKERTREVRQELADYRDELAKEQARERDEAIERKMRQIEARRQRKEEKRQKDRQMQGLLSALGASPLSALAGAVRPASSAQAPASNEATVSSDSFAGASLSLGDTCRIIGQTAVGKIEQIQGKRAIVLFGMMRTTVDLKKLEPAKPEKPQPVQKVDYSYISRQTQEQMHKTQLTFQPELDIRGMRADEALQTITRYIDDATLIGAGRVRILHGTGTGALRQLVRQYLSTVHQVSSAKDEHVQFGGAGITVVELRY